MNPESSSMQEILKKLKRYEIQIRKALTAHLQGDYKSIFKGSGLEFDDVRPYQYGDDVRTIDWNVSAKGHGTFVKTFKEEKEQTVLFAVDVSASQRLGDAEQEKIDLTREVSGVLALSALREASHVGLLLFSDRREKSLKPNKSKQQAYRFLHTLYHTKPESRSTNLRVAILQCMQALKHKSMVILVSDFVDEDFYKPLGRLARAHDLILVHVHSKRERQWPKLGILPLYEKEQKRRLWVNTSSRRFQQDFVQYFDTQQKALVDFAKKHRASYLSLATQEDYVPKLISFFEQRKALKTIL